MYFITKQAVVEDLLPKWTPAKSLDGNSDKGDPGEGNRAGDSAGSADGGGDDRGGADSDKHRGLPSASKRHKTGETKEVFTT